MYKYVYIYMMLNVSTSGIERAGAEGRGARVAGRDVLVPRPVLCGVIYCINSIYIFMYNIYIHILYEYDILHIIKCIYSVYVMHIP